MLAVFITAIITFFVASLFGYVVHYALHQDWSGRFHQTHMTHHLKMYPPEDCISDVYRAAGKDNTLWIFAGAALPLVLGTILLGIFGILPLGLMITALLVMAVMSFLHSYLHDAFHIRNHWLYRVPLLGKVFIRWVHLHWLHHVDMNYNYGIFLFHWDHVFKTFWDIK
jgi:hypothetical protein